MAAGRKGSILIEFVKIGRYIKVSAIDERTGMEASIVGDPKRSQKALEDAAVRKLRYVMKKYEDNGGTEGGGRGGLV